jgi:hypothetical protein
MALSALRGMRRAGLADELGKIGVAGGLQAGVHDGGRYLHEFCNFVAAGEEPVGKEVAGGSVGTCVPSM